MPATILEGKTLAARLQQELQAEVSALAAAGSLPRLDVLMLGQDPGSTVYVRNKERACRRLGIDSRLHALPATASHGQVRDLIASLNADPAVHGILVQQPLPPGLDTRALVDAITPDKDVDGLTATNLGRLVAGQPGLAPCTPQAVLALLDHAQIDLAGKRVIVVGRSAIVGKPLAHLLLNRHATVTICHSRTRELTALTASAEVLIVAVGHAGLVTAEMVAPGAVVIDVGTNPQPDGQLRGDVDFESVRQVASVLTPVPGGVGPLTVAMLMRNVVQAVTWPRSIR